VHHRPASDSDCPSDLARLVGKSLADSLDQLSKRFIFMFTRFGVAIKRNRIGSKHCLKIGGVVQGKLEIAAAYSLYGLGRFGPGLGGSAHEQLSEL
jgi:hypothetical protein